MITRRKALLVVFLTVALVGTASWVFLSQKPAPTIVFLESGDLWKADFKLEDRKLLIQGQNVSQFTFTPNGTIYFINEEGELIKRTEEGGYDFLITTEENSKSIPQSSESGEDLAFKKGKVLHFAVSPNGKYIMYMTFEKLTGCCAAPPTFPTGDFWVMKNDGTDKKQIKIPPNYPGNLWFDGWLPNSKGFIFHAALGDESTQGRPFYEADIETGQSRMFNGIEYIHLDGGEYVTTVVALAEPSFSSDGDKVAYRRDGIYGNEIWMASVDGSEQKMVLGNFDSVASVLRWSTDGDLLMVAVDDGVYTFNKMGEIVFQSIAAITERGSLSSAIFSEDKRYIGTMLSSMIVRYDTTSGEYQRIPVQSIKGSKNYVSDKMFFSRNGDLYYFIDSHDETGAQMRGLWVADFNNNQTKKIGGSGIEQFHVIR